MVNNNGNANNNNANNNNGVLLGFHAAGILGTAPWGK